MTNGSEDLPGRDASLWKSKWQLADFAIEDANIISELYAGVLDADTRCHPYRQSL